MLFAGSPSCVVLSARQGPLAPLALAAPLALTCLLYRAATCSMKEQRALSKRSKAQRALSKRSKEQKEKQQAAAAERANREAAAAERANRKAAAAERVAAVRRLQQEAAAPTKHVDTRGIEWHIQKFDTSTWAADLVRTDTHAQYSRRQTIPRSYQTIRSWQ